MQTIFPYLNSLQVTENGAYDTRMMGFLIGCSRYSDWLADQYGQYKLALVPRVCLFAGEARHSRVESRCNNRFLNILAVIYSAANVLNAHNRKTVKISLEKKNCLFPSINVILFSLCEKK